MKGLRQPASRPTVVSLLLRGVPVGVLALSLLSLAVLGLACAPRPSGQRSASFPETDPSAPAAPTGTPALRVERMREPVRVDGLLREPCYAEASAVADFRVASRPGARAPETRAWLSWDDRGLHFAFAARDGEIVVAPPSADEHAVDAQDRVEVFLWPEGSERYFCVEIAPDGAVHDYAARLYRQFDDGWSPAGAAFAARRTEMGYAAEGFLPVEAVRAMGVATWGLGTRVGLGLFRAEFHPDASDDPAWLTWIEPGLPRADFHVRAAFGTLELVE